MSGTISSIIGIIGSLGIVQLVLSRDEESRRSCLQLCSELDEHLEDLADYLINPSRNAQDDLVKIKHIKQIIKQLSTEKVRLVFPYDPLNKLLTESFQLFDRLRLRDGNQANQSHFIASELNILWGMKAVRPYKFSEIQKIQQFLKKTLFERLFIWSYSFVTRPFRSRCNHYESCQRKKETESSHG